MAVATTTATTTAASFDEELLGASRGRHEAELLAVCNKVQHDDRVAVVKEVVKVTLYDNEINEQNSSTSNDGGSRC